MSFVIRQIATRADGGEIIRSRTLAADAITIGRGTDCDIQLADLGLLLRHVRLVRLPAGRVAVEALGGVPVEIGGAFVTRADLALADSPAIDMASHRLQLSLGDDGAVAVTAERVIAAIDAADAAQEIGIFSLRHAMPTKRRMAWAGALAVLALLFLWPLLHFLGEASPALPRNMVAAAARPGPAPAQDANSKSVFQPDMAWSTGTLSKAHVGLANNCGACHQQAFVSVTDSACQSCHTPSALPAHAPPARLARGQLPESGIIGAAHSQFNLPQGRCASCHSEHEGPAAVTTVAQEYCTDCHAGLDTRLANTGLANVSGWDKHPQFRPRVVTAPSARTPQFARVSLASARENSGLLYPHDLHLSRKGAVANMAQKQGLALGSGGGLGCAYCHEPDAGGVRFRPITMEKNCGACHDLAFARGPEGVRSLPHGKPDSVAGIIRDFTLSGALQPRGAQTIAFSRRPPGAVTNPSLATSAIAANRAETAVAAVFGPRGLCGECHGVTASGGRYAVAPVTLGDHYLTRGQFPHKQHRIFDRKTGDAACTACHDDTMASKRSSDVLLPPIATCRQCHATPAVRGKVPADCNSCHSFHQDAPAPLRIAAVRPAGFGS